MLRVADFRVPVDHQGIIESSLSLNCVKVLIVFMMLLCAAHRDFDGVQEYAHLLVTHYPFEIAVFAGIENVNRIYWEDVLVRICEVVLATWLSCHLLWSCSKSQLICDLIGEQTPRLQFPVRVSGIATIIKALDGTS